MELGRKPGPDTCQVSSTCGLHPSPNQARGPQMPQVCPRLPGACGRGVTSLWRSQAQWSHVLQLGCVRRVQPVLGVHTPASAGQCGIRPGARPPPEPNLVLRNSRVFLGSCLLRRPGLHFSLWAGISRPPEPLEVAMEVALASDLQLPCCAMSGQNSRKIQEEQCSCSRVTEIRLPPGPRPHPTRGQTRAHKFFSIF